MKECPLGLDPIYYPSMSSKEREVMTVKERVFIILLIITLISTLIVVTNFWTEVLQSEVVFLLRAMGTVYWVGLVVHLVLTGGVLWLIEMKEAGSKSKREVTFGGD